MSHPYKSVKDYQRWRTAVSDLFYTEIDWRDNKQLTINRDEKIVSIGSCFAQHIAEWLRRFQFNYLITESTASENRDNMFSARYGNVYTPLQAAQLLERSMGGKAHQLSRVAWLRDDNRYVDPLRPVEFANGFSSPEDVTAERKQHLLASRDAFLNADIVIWTLGLTEGWLEAATGVVVPQAPGISAGKYDSNEYRFINLSFEEVLESIRGFNTMLLSKNRNVRLLLTVSPVPLTATFVDRSVVLSNSVSKSILRAAADRAVNEFDNVYYFPSYEIISFFTSRAAYYNSDLRTVSELGVETVMKLFLKTVGGLDSNVLDWIHPHISKGPDCDEELIEKMLSKNT